MLVFLTLAWGALGFGGAYRWTSWPLIAACLTTSAVIWMVPAGRAAWRLLWPLALIVLAIVAQLVPLSSHVLSTLSPSALGVVARLAETTPESVTSHPVSLLPRNTWHALALFVTFAVWLLALSKLFSAIGTRWLVRGVVIMSVALAALALEQKAVHPDAVFGFWKPYMGAVPFGPFINRNHFAGWMLMALPLALAFLCAEVARGLRDVRPTFHDRFLWLSSHQAGTILMLAAAAVVMGVSLVMTMSRSGMSACVVGLALTAAFVVRGMTGVSRRTVATVYLAGLIVLVVGVVGIDAIVNRFAESDWAQFNGRLGAAKEAVAIGKRFPLVGTGLNTYGVATLFYTKYDFDDPDRFAQAHNDYAQLFAEGGLLLAIPALLLVAVVAFETWRRFRDDERGGHTWWIRAGAVTGLLCMAMQETVEFSLQMPGDAALFVALCAVAVHRRQRIAPAKDIG